MSILLRNAQESSADASWLSNVFPLYLHDLSGYGSEFWSLDETGRWQPEHVLAEWLTRPEVSPLLLLAHGRRIGFAFVGHTPFPYKSPEVDHVLAEFFVLAPYRRQGHGAEAAREVLRRFPGSWELEVLLGNAPARRFWSRLVSALPGLRVELDGSVERFSFVIQEG